MHRIFLKAETDNPFVLDNLGRLIPKQEVFDWLEKVDPAIEINPFFWQVGSNGLWVYDGWPDRGIHAFTFKELNDALLFKLTWGGAFG